MTSQILQSMSIACTAHHDKLAGTWAARSTVGSSEHSGQLGAQWSPRSRCIADVLCLLMQLFGDAMPAAEAAFSLLGAALACLLPLFFYKEVRHGSLNPVILVQ